MLHEAIHAYMIYRNTFVRKEGHPQAAIDALQHDVMAADVNGNALRTSEPEPVNKCLEDIIGDCVYLLPTRWVPPYKLPSWDRVFTEGRRRDVTGVGGGIYVTFFKDGTYKVTPMG
jgi:hypothetical protein